MEIKNVVLHKNMHKLHNKTLQMLYLCGFMVCMITFEEKDIM